ncbi:MAG TPA: hypothetical protein GXZ76_04460 [Clostridiaceae bacterium]|nr:hypothetical protein [Clostridiaceae bacterium]
MSLFQFERDITTPPEETTFSTDNKMSNKKELRVQWLLLLFTFIWFFCIAYNFDEILLQGIHPPGFSQSLLFPW